MKIYLAGGAGVMTTKGREKELAMLFSPWRRLFTFYYKEKHMLPSDILQIKNQQKNENSTKKKEHIC